MNILKKALIATTLMVAAAPVLADDIRAAEAEQLRAAGTIKSEADLQGIALGIHPGATVLETELEREHNRYEYKVELRDAQGQQWDLEIDAATGEVYEDEQDD